MPDWKHHTEGAVGTRRSAGTLEDGRPTYHYDFHPELPTFHPEPADAHPDAGLVADTGDAYTAYYVGRDIQGTLELDDGSIVNLGEDYIPLRMSEVPEVEHKLGLKLQDDHPLHRDPEQPFVHNCTAMCDDAVANAKAVYAAAKQPPADTAPSTKKGGKA